MKARGSVFKYGDNVDTDVIIPARYLNIADPVELATHCMEDIDTEFVKNVKKGDIMVATKNFGCGSAGYPRQWHFLRHRIFFRSYFLSFFYQHRPADYGERRSCQCNQCRRRGRG